MKKKGLLDNGTLKWCLVQQTKQKILIQKVSDVIAVVLLTTFALIQPAFTEYSVDRFIYKEPALQDKLASLGRHELLFMLRTHFVKFLQGFPGAYTGLAVVVLLLIYFSTWNMRHMLLWASLVCLVVIEGSLFFLVMWPHGIFICY